MLVWGCVHNCAASMILEWKFGIVPRLYTGFMEGKGVQVATNMQRDAARPNAT